VKIDAFSVIQSIPFEFLECRSISGIDNCTRNIGKRNQGVQCQPVPEAVVFQDSPEEEIFIDLECVPATDDSVVIYLFVIRISEEVHVRNVENKAEFLNGLILKVSPEPASISLIGIFRVVVDSSCVSVKKTPKNMLRDLGCCLKTNSTPPESFSCKDLIGN
jgi:hypothetical protein